MSALAAPHRAAARPGRPAGPRVRLSPTLTISAVVLVGILGAWEAIVQIARIPPILFPAPSRVFTALIRGLSDTGRAGYYGHAAVTLEEALLGFAIGSVLGLALAVVIAQARIVEQVLYPYIVMFQSLPKTAIAPLFIVWFGFGLASKILLSVTVTFFPVMIGALAGFRAVDRDRLDLMRSLNASRWLTFRLVVFPGALPYIFAGLDIALVYSVVSAIVGEFVGGQAGLGVLILNMNQGLDIAGVFSVLLILSLMGWALSLLLKLVRVRLLFWAETGADEMGGLL